MMLAYLGDGCLSFQVAVGATASGERFFSHDYGRTWPERVPVPPADDGLGWSVEGNPLVETGLPVRVAEIGYGYPRHQPRYAALFENRIRWSEGGGRTWGREIKPDEWNLAVRHEGKDYMAGSSEGSLVRAENGRLVSAHRLTIPPRYYVDLTEDAEFDDSRRGWAFPYRKMTAEPGRPSGCYMKRAAITRTSSHLCSALLGDGFILTCNGHYLSKGVALVLWKP
ncbi:MAG: exo-alpha-sialidase [Armatimonadetes bacterium]|nr:exo-alpha-sialidase [Armatimonadota bacterium]